MSNIKSIYFYLRVFIQYSWLYYFLVKFRSKYKGHFVMKDTQIVVEGWPRSGNTFLVFCLNFLAEKENLNLKMAHHIHVPFQIKLGVQYGIKSVVLIRNPKDSISSLIIKRNKGSQIDSDYIHFLLTSYIMFYNIILKYSDYIIIYKFEDVINKSVEVLDDLNLFNCYLKDIDFFEEYKSVLSKRLKVDRTGAEIALPTFEKDILKGRVFQSLESHNKFNKAFEVYQRVHEKSVKF